MISGVLFFAVAGCSLVAGSVQTPELNSCSSTEEIDISDLTISGAKIGEKFTLNFTLEVSQELDSDPKLEITITREDGNKVPCFGTIGSCSYRLCEGESSIEERLGQLWDNKCPVPEITAPVTVGSTLSPIVEFAIGKAPTKLTIELKVTDGGEPVGCVSFSVDIEKADS
ncbi:uncharacterized protein LOC144103691 [Amblyomma americanum]